MRSAKLETTEPILNCLGANELNVDTQEAIDAVEAHAYTVAVPPGWAGEPLIIAFFIPLPVPLGLPGGYVYSFDQPETVEWLRDVPFRPTIDQPVQARASDVANYVSLRVWRPKANVRIAAQPFGLALRTARAVAGGDMASAPASPDAGPTFNSDETVFEAVTPLIHPEKGGVKEAVNEAFDRCVDEIANICRAHLSAVGDLRVRIPSRENLFPTIPFATRHPSEMKFGPIGVITINAGYRIAVGPTELNDDMHRQLRERLFVMKQGSQFTRYNDWRSTAMQMWHLDGMYSPAVVALYSASEALFDALLLTLTWEKGEKSAREINRLLLDEGLAKRVRTHYAPLLQGRWDTNDDRTVLWQWHEHVAKPRHLVTHAGVLLQAQAAQLAFDALEQTTEYIKSRLVAKRSVFPRTTLMILGKPGLERFKVYSGKIKRFVEEVLPSEPSWTDSYHHWLLEGQ